MANRIKYNAGLDSNALNIDNWSVGVDGTGMGPSSSTGFKTGIIPPNDGYTIYSDNIKIRTAANSEELISILNKMGASVAPDNLYNALKWAKSNNVLVVNKTFKDITTDGLVLNLDSDHISNYFDNEPTTNMVSSGDQDHNNMVIWTNSGEWIWSDNVTDVPKPFTYESTGLKIMKGTSVSRGSQHFGTASVSVVGGQTYTASVWYRQSRAGASSPYFRTNVNNNNLTYLSYNGSTNSSTWPVNQWIRISGTATVQANETGMYISNYLGRVEGDMVWYYAPQVESGSNLTPFSDGTRAQHAELVDTSGGSNNATLSGNPTLDSDRNLVFDGSGDYAQINSHAAFTVNARTIEITFKMNGSYNDLTPLAVYANGSSSTNRIWLGIQNSRFRMHGWGTTDPQGSTAINADTWYTCVFSYDKSSQQMKVYTNGNLESTSTNNQSGVTATTGMNWYLATVPGSWQGNTYSNVTIKSFKVYDKILSDAEVAQNYYTGPITTRNLKQHYDFSNIMCYKEGDTSIRNLANASETAAITNTDGAISYNSHLGYLEWNGTSNAYIDVPDTGQMAKFSLSTWVYNEHSGSNSRHSILRNFWEIVDTSIQFWSYDFDNDYWRSSGNGAVPYNEWTHITTTWDGSVIRHYINGVLYWTDLNTSGGTSQSMYHFGGYNGRMLDGKYATLSVYDDALTNQEILDNYNANAAAFK